MCRWLFRRAVRSVSGAVSSVLHPVCPSRIALALTANRDSWHDLVYDRTVRWKMSTRDELASGLSR